MNDPFETIQFSAEEAARIVRQSYGAVVPQEMPIYLAHFRFTKPVNSQIST